MSSFLYSGSLELDGNNLVERPYKAAGSNPEGPVSDLCYISKAHTWNHSLWNINTTKRFASTMRVGYSPLRSMHRVRSMRSMTTCITISPGFFLIFRAILTATSFVEKRKPDFKGE